MRFTRDNVKVGDTLLLLDGRSEPREVTVAKVGRTLVHIQRPWGTDPFRMSDGCNSGSYRQAELMTSDQYAEHQRRAALIDELRERGLFRSYAAPEFPLATLEALARVLRGDTPDVLSVVWQWIADVNNGAGFDADDLGYALTQAGHGPPEEAS